MKRYVLFTDGAPSEWRPTCPVPQGEHGDADRELQDAGYSMVALYGEPDDGISVAVWESYNPMRFVVTLSTDVNQERVGCDSWRDLLGLLGDLRRAGLVP